MKNLKRALSFILCAAMLVSFVPFTAWGESYGYNTYGSYECYLSWNYDYVIITGYTGVDSDLVIPSKIYNNYGHSYPVKGIDENAFKDCTTLTSVRISYGVTYINRMAFYGCTSLTSITIPSSVTSIGGNAFNGCTALESINISSDNSVYHSDGKCIISSDKTLVCACNIQEIPDDGSVTSIGGNAFSGCTGLTSITIPDSITSIGEKSFSGCTSLTSVTIPDSVTCIKEYAFSDCTSLSSVTIPDSVTCIDRWVFSGCTNLTSITIPDSVTCIDREAFSGCTSLLSINIPNSVTSIGQAAFQNCTSLSSVIIGNSVTGTGVYAFQNCTSLTSITIPDSVKSIDYYSFSGCTSLTSLNIPDSVTSIGQCAFQNCTSLSDISLPDSVQVYSGAFTNTAYYNDSNNWKSGVLYLGNHLITAKSDAISGTYIIIPGTISISQSAFYNCNNLDKITIPDSVTTVCDSAFYGCSLWRVYYIGTEAQWNSINIGSNNKPLTDARKVYECESSLLSLSLPTIPNIVNYPIGAEFDETGLTVAEVYSSGYNKPITTGYTISGFDSSTPGTKTLTVTYGELSASFDVNVFPLEFTQSGETLTITGYTGNGGELTIPSTLSGYQVTAIGDNAFSRCKSLTSVTIPESVTSIGTYAFNGCTGLTSIDIPQSVTLIREGTFYDCRSLESIILPDSVTKIGGSAFRNCTNLNTVSIPSALTKISNNAFAGCGTPSMVVYCGSPSQWEQITIGTGNEEFLQTIYYSNPSDYYYSVSSDKETRVTGYHGTGGNIAIPSTLGGYPVVGIQESAFSNYSNYDPKSLTSVVIPDGVRYICPYAFYDCTNLESVIIPDSVTIIYYYAFYNCSSLTSVTIPEGVTSIDYYSFYNCSSLTSVTIPDSVTSIGHTAFWGCASLTSITIPESVSSIGAGAFSNCTNLTSLSIPDSVKSIGENAFRGCASLTSINVSEENPKYQSTGNCLISPDSQKLILGCQNSVIPDDGSVTSIGADAFYNCTNLTSINIPGSVTTIGNSAFSGCTGLESVRYMGSEAAFGRISVGSGNEPLLTAEIVFTPSFIRIMLMPLKTVYAVGEEFDPAGIAAALFYGDDTISLTTKLEYSGFDSSTPGTKTVMASYAGVQTEFEVTVTGSADPVEPDPVRPDPVEPDPAEDAPMIVVETVRCLPGATEVEVAVRVENNPGFFALLMERDFAVSLEYLGFEDADGVSAYGATTAPNINVMALGMADIEGDGVIFTLFFDVPADTAFGEYAISFNYLSGNDFDENLLDFGIVPGAVIVEPLYGDVDGSGEVDSIDLTLLREYLTDPDNTSVSDGVDVNRDGVINTLDITRLRKILSGDI